MLTGDGRTRAAPQLWAASERRLIFCTPHVFKNDLENGLLDARRVVCAVFDECHHAATEKTVYAHVARHLREGRGKDHVCRVLALSATAGTTLGKVQGVIDALGISRVEMRTEENLREYMHQTDFRIVTIRQPRVQALTSKGGGGGGGASKAQNRATLRELLYSTATPKCCGFRASMHYRVPPSCVRSTLLKWTRAQGSWTRARMPRRRSAALPAGIVLLV